MPTQTLELLALFASVVASHVTTRVVVVSEPATPASACLCGASQFPISRPSADVLMRHDDAMDLRNGAYGGWRLIL